MTALFMILSAIAITGLGYIFYGKYLSKQWDVNDSHITPAHSMKDGMDYVPASEIVVFGHHFSSIAGAGPINGPILATAFGWLPVMLWCIIGGIFVGGVHDFGSLLASLRNKGESVGNIIGKSMSLQVKKMFLIFAIIVALLGTASFISVICGSFATLPDENGVIVRGLVANPTAGQTAAFVSVCFGLIAIFFGMMMRRTKVSLFPATVIGLVMVALCIWAGLYWGIALSRNEWIIVIGLYIAAAALAPVDLLLQPRDYLSSFLLYAMMLIAVLGIISSAFTGTVHFELPAFTGFTSQAGDLLFPTLFITVSCGACSGIHSIIATGTTSKQLDRETEAKPVAYGGMLVESVLGVIAVIAVGCVYQEYASGIITTPGAAFARGIALMIGQDGSVLYSTVNAILILAVSVFILTSLDTSVRLCRFLISELLLKEEEKSYKDISGVRRYAANPYIATFVIVALCSVLGELSLTKIWGLFGVANQLLSAIVLITLALWFKEAGYRYRMLVIPMIFMSAAAVVSIVLTIFNKVSLIVGTASAADWGDWFQLFFAAGMLVLITAFVKEALKSAGRYKTDSSIHA